MVFKYLCLLFLCLVFNSSAQNLVPNGSFEQYYSCPVFNGEADTCIGWHSFGGIIGATGTPDYFNSCSIVVGVPDNLCGRQMAYQGNGYMGLFYQRLFLLVQRNYRNSTTRHTDREEIITSLCVYVMVIPQVRWRRVLRRIKWE
jgi:hypothetical protein